MKAGIHTNGNRFWITSEPTAVEKIGIKRLRRVNTRCAELMEFDRLKFNDAWRLAVREETGAILPEKRDFRLTVKRQGV